MIVGIDLGTTNSLIGVWRDGAAALIPNALGSVLTPSAVSVDADGSILVGMAARERLSTEPARSVAAFKRTMGTERVTRLGRQSFRPEELSALVLRALKADAERALGHEVRDAIVTVPAYFGDAQRKATRAAGEIAGLRVVRLLNEPTAAALAYGLHQEAPEQRVLVLDLGGGTFDVSILELFEGIMEVRACAGDNFLGGEDFVDAIMDGFLAETGLPPRSRGVPLHAALRRAAEVAKRALSDAESHQMVLVDKGRELRWTLTRDRFEQLSRPLLARVQAPVERALRDARLMPDQIDHLVLAGGATRMPLFRRLAARLFRRLPFAAVHPEEVVARGAAVQAGLEMRDAALADRVMTDVAPFTLGFEVCQAHGGQVVASGLFHPLIERNTTIPASRSTRIYTVADRQRQIRLRVFQGEARMVADNILLGELDLAVPPAPAGEQAADVRFTYDTSGLLEVEAQILGTGMVRRRVIENQPGVLSADEITARLAALAHLKLLPAEQAENQAVLARAERLFTERIGDERAEVAARLDHFRLLLAGQDPGELAAFRAAFEAWLDSVDVSFFR